MATDFAGDFPGSRFRSGTCDATTVSTQHPLQSALVLTREDLVDDDEGREV